MNREVASVIKSITEMPNVTDGHGRPHLNSKNGPKTFPMTINDHFVLVQKLIFEECGLQWLK